MLFGTLFFGGDLCRGEVTVKVGDFVARVHGTKGREGDLLSEGDLFLLEDPFSQSYIYLLYQIDIRQVEPRWNLFSDFERLLFANTDTEFVSYIFSFCLNAVSSLRLH